MNIIKIYLIILLLIISQVYLTNVSAESSIYIYKFEFIQENNTNEEIIFVTLLILNDDIDSIENINVTIFINSIFYETISISDIKKRNLINISINESTYNIYKTDYGIFNFEAKLDNNNTAVVAFSFFNERENISNDRENNFIKHKYTIILIPFIITIFIILIFKIKKNRGRNDNYIKKE